MKFWLRLRVPLGFLLAAWYAALVRPPIGPQAFMGFLAIACGCALRSWSAGYLLKGKRVAVGGPYAYIRNPLYVGSFLIGFGCCAMLWRSPLPLSVGVFYAVFLVGFLGLYVAKIGAEETELVDSLGAAYTSYAARVPPILPLRGKITGLGHQRFSRELYRRNREYRCLFGAGLLLAFIGLKGLCMKPFTGLATGPGFCRIPRASLSTEK